MVLISLLVVLLIERYTRKSRLWQGEYYASRYRGWLMSSRWLSERTDNISLYGQLIFPVLVVIILSHAVFGGLIQFIFETLILFVCIGCPSLRNIYRNFLNAASRDDLEACSLYTEQLGHCNAIPFSQEADAASQGKSFGQHLLWINYQHYAAIIVLFIVFGAAGAVFYVLARAHTDYFCEQDEHEKLLQMKKLMHVLNFVPARIVAFGLLLVGDFSRALPVWMKYALDFNAPAEEVLTQVAAKAEYVREGLPEEEWDATTEPKALVTLAKRNMVLLVSLTALLTLMGLIQ